MMVIDPDRVSNPNLVFDQASRKGGVDLGPWGEPLAYHIRSAHPGDYGVIGAFPWKWDRIPRFYSNGRWSVVHAFEPKRAGQVRGEPPLAPIIKKLHMITRYDQAELQAAALNAVLAATVSSPNDHEQLAASMGDTSGGKDVALSGLQDARLGFYEQRGLDMPGVRVNYLFPEDKLELTRPGHPNPAFEAFERVALRNVAASAGLSYEQMTGDFSQSNYSSFRGALLEVWRGFTARKDNWASLYKGPHYSNWLEEAFELGHINYPKGAPRFRDARAAYTAAVWIGPARGQVDEVKESNAALIRIAGGLSTYEAECAQMGKDHLEVFDERARERAEMKKRGLDPDSLLRPKLPFGTQPGAQQPAAPEDQHPEPQGGNPDDEGASV